jgi:hypothetical protein
MFSDNEKVINFNWKNAVKYGIAVIVFLSVIYNIILVVKSKFNEEDISQFIAKQQAEFREFQTNHDKGIKTIQDGMSDGAKEVEKNILNFQNKADNFHDDFNKSLAIEKAIVHERLQSSAISEFLEEHVIDFDKDVYERGRDKFIKQTTYNVPNYEQYNQLREAAKHCRVIKNNAFSQDEYANKIAEIRSEHREDLIKTVPKPAILNWPLSYDESKELILKNYMNFFIVLSKKGECLYG